MVTLKRGSVDIVIDGRDWDGTDLPDIFAVKMYVPENDQMTVAWDELNATDETNHEPLKIRPTAVVVYHSFTKKVSPLGDDEKVYRGDLDTDLLSKSTEYLWYINLPTDAPTKFTIRFPDVRVDDVLYPGVMLHYAAESGWYCTLVKPIIIP
jgi:hypothetical protein